MRMEFMAVLAECLWRFITWKIIRISTELSNEAYLITTIWPAPLSHWRARQRSNGGGLFNDYQLTCLLFAGGGLDEVGVKAGGDLVAGVIAEVPIDMVHRGGQ
jgi:hypothetical protein